MFNVNRNNNQFVYASTVIDGEKTSMEYLSYNSYSILILILTLNQTQAKAQTLHLFLIIIIKESLSYIQLLHRVHMN